jgi:hypothetical protein
VYSSCTFCYGDLGRNEAIEHFTVGRRLAFDGARGRLWVVCPHCERWNLTPLEERWEAIEECEQAFLDTRLRVATENIGLARLREGLELVRIGEPPRTEFAGWRYGDQFGRRRRRHMVVSGLGLATGGAMLATGTIGGLAGLGAYALAWAVRKRLVPEDHPTDVVARVPADASDVISLMKKDLWSVGMRAAEGPERWRLVFHSNHKKHELMGDAALRAAAQVLPYMNRASAPGRKVRSAVDYLQQLREPLDAFWAVADSLEKRSLSKHPNHFRLDAQPAVVRLALEMAAHEETERRAMEGELALLEQTWKQAEEIAAIADRLTLPPSVEGVLKRLRGG